VRINEPDQTSAPLIFIGKTKNETVKYYKYDLPQPLIDQIDEVTQREVNIVNVCKILEKYKTLKTVWIGPAYSFPELIPSNYDRNVCLITDLNRHYLEKYFPDLNEEYEYRSPIVGYIEDNCAVSICCTARSSSRAIEASLLTIEQYRGKGFADKVVLEWSREVRKIGQIPLYSTSWDNLSSQRVAQKLGLMQYGMDFNISAE
jgi:GNAT superfamily N-acetyltransferase